MKIALPALVATTMLAALPAAAFTPERAGIFVDALKANDCAMHGDEASDRLGPTGLEPLEVQAFVDTLFAAGLVALSEDMQTLRLTDMLCESDSAEAMEMIVEAFVAQEARIERWLPEFEPERGAELIALIRAEDCALTDARAQEILPQAGFTPVETRDIVAVMSDGEMASVSEDGTALMLSPDVCNGDPEADAPAFATLISTWEERHPAPEVVFEEGVEE